MGVQQGDNGMEYKKVIMGWSTTNDSRMGWNTTRRWWDGVSKVIMGWSKQGDNGMEYNKVIMGWSTTKCYRDGMEYNRVIVGWSTR